MELIDYPRMRFEAIRQHPLVIADRPAAFEITGAGALDCLQGLLTNDLAKPGPGSLVYGAMLTPKGMIVADYWVLRLDDRFVLVTDPAGRAPSLELFRRQLPPRLARVADRSDEWSAAWILGDGIERELAPVADPPPEGRALSLTTAEGPLVIGAAPARAPFRYLAIGPEPAVAGLTRGLRGAGVPIGDRRDLRAARVRTGWPTLGQEIDERTMPAEADFEGVGGVSYTKGCYVGQETVARVHFRGHPNWLLRRVDLPDARAPEAEIAADGKPVAKLRTVLRFEDGSGIGLAQVRREVEPGSTVAQGDFRLTIPA